MSNCNKELIKLLNTMNECIEIKNDNEEFSCISESFKENINVFVDGFIMIEKVIQQHSKELSEIILNERNSLANGLEITINKINNEEKYLINDYYTYVIEPYKKWSDIIRKNISQ